MDSLFAYRAPPPLHGYGPYLRRGVVGASTVLPLLGQSRANLLGVEVGTNSLRLLTYKVHGCQCVRCGTRGTYFAVERQMAPGQHFHLNLYGFDENDQEVMITSDHRFPRSKGGSDRLDNRQPMCAPCNFKKADKIGG